MTTLEVARRSLKTVIAVQRRIIATPDIDPEWAKLGWQAIDDFHDIFTDALNHEPIR